MASRSWHNDHQSSQRSDLSRGRGPGPWQDGYQRYGDDHSSAYDSGNWGTYDGYQRGYGYHTDAPYSNGWGPNPTQEYGHASSAGQYYSSEAYNGHYQDPYYSESYSRGYDQSYQPYSHGYNGDAQSIQGFNADWSRRPEPPRPSRRSQTQRSYHSLRSMADTHERPPERRIRSPPPQAVLPEPPRSPSPNYLKLVDDGPQHLANYHDGRKLLILDLNGTLVYRSPYRPKNKHAYVSAPAAGDLGDTGSGTTSGPPLPRLRTAHPRPYIPSFRSYLFAPETQAWLDVMIWSSAQPHSVQGMVERVFGEEAYADGIANTALGSAAVGAMSRVAGEETSGVAADGVESGGEKVGCKNAAPKPRLVAIWARDTLGLSDSHYCTSYPLI